VILVDTSIWVDHLRHGEGHLVALLGDASVLVHSFVIGEVALGSLRNRETVLSSLAGLPTATEASHDEVLHFIDAHALMGRGIGYVDAHLLASTLLTSGARLWTGDRRLAAVAAELDCGYAPAGA